MASHHQQHLDIGGGGGGGQGNDGIDYDYFSARGYGGGDDFFGLDGNDTMEIPTIVSTGM